MFRDGFNGKEDDFVLATRSEYPSTQREAVKWLRNKDINVPIPADLMRVVQWGDNKEADWAYNQTAFGKWYEANCCFIKDIVILEEHFKIEAEAEVALELALRDLIIPTGNLAYTPELCSRICDDPETGLWWAVVIIHFNKK